MIFTINSNLIFSDERKYRIQRHLLFWIFWILYFALVREFNPRYFKSDAHFPSFFQSFVQSVLWLLPQSLLVYSMLYFVLPRYVFTGKYLLAIVSSFFVLFLTVSVNAAFLSAVPWQRTMYTPQDIEIFKGVSSGWLKIKLAYLLALQGSMVAASLAVSIKLFKHFYLKNLRVVQLQKENIATQLQILKAEIHPHFLFNTLNNIFYQIQDESPKGSKMIKGLSDILSYILYNGQNQYVPLKQELLMIKEYISLEKIRYGNKLDIYIKLPEKMDDVYIAPFLLLPFVENCFKHGTSNMLQNPWINLSVELTDTLLTMKLINGKVSVKQETNSQSGIGISNVRQRLELLYKGKYNLQIKDEDDVFVVDLKVELARKENLESINNPDEQKVEITYA